MKTNMIDTKEVILALKRVKKDKKLSNEKIYQMVKDKDFSTSVSLTTVNRVFKKGSENIVFRYEATLRPIANALLDMEEYENTDDNEKKAIKSILILKQEIITELERKLKTVEPEEHHIKSIEHLQQQLEYKDKRIDQLLDANDELRKELTKLTDRILKCQRCDK